MDKGWGGDRAYEQQITKGCNLNKYNCTNY